MPLQQLVYSPPRHAAKQRKEPFVMMVDDEMLHKYQKDRSIPLTQVVDSFQVFRFANPGTEGELMTPSRNELEDVFGTTDEYKITEFMIDHGVLHGRETPIVTAGYINDDEEEHHH